MTKYYDRDRAHGQGLPANISDASLLRVARRMTNTPTPTRYDTPTQVMAAGFEPVADHPGMYRNAHAVWALRAAEDGEGYVLVRTKEELAPDMRTASKTAQYVSSYAGDQESMPTSARPKVGDRVAMVHRGQLADAMIVLINPAEQLADLVLDGTNEHVRDVPCDQLLAPPEPDTMTIELVPAALGGSGDDPFEPGMEPSSKAAQYVPGRAHGHESEIDNMVEVTRAFQPKLYGGQITLPKDRLFDVLGQSAGTPEADEMVGLDDLPTPLYPAEGEHPGAFIRMRLRDDETGVMVVVLPDEFEDNMAARGSFPRPQSHHRGRPRSTPADRAPTEPSPDRTPTVVDPQDRADTVRER